MIKKLASASLAPMLNLAGRLCLAVASFGHQPTLR